MCRLREQATTQKSHSNNKYQPEDLILLSPPKETGGDYEVRTLIFWCYFWKMQKKISET